MAELVVEESYVRSRTGDPGGGGDAVVVTAHFAAVLDGVTGKTRLHFDGLPSDRFAARVAADTIRELPADVTAAEAVAAINDALVAAVADCGLGDGLVHMPGVVAGIVSFARNELWQVGDVNALVDDLPMPGFPPPTDRVLADLRSAYLGALLLAGAGVDELRGDDPSTVVLRPMLEQQDQYANHPMSPWSYGVINGTAVPHRHIHVHALGRARVVALASDGFVFPGSTLALTLQRHAELRDSDPLCIGDNRQVTRSTTVGWDDMAYLRVCRDA